MNTHNSIKNTSESVPIELFAAEFEKFSNEAFRFEYVQDFSVPAEEDGLKKFKLGQSDPDPEFNIEWREIIKAANLRGAVMSRVRFIRHPFSKYLQFEFLWGYRNNLKWGERIRVINEDQLLSLSQFSFLQDFWLFDNQRAYLIDYSENGEFLGVKKANSESIDFFIRFKEKLIQGSRLIDNTLMDQILHLNS